jgi:prevent-host-death family protein
MGDESVGIRELKQNASAVVAKVKAGETVVVTERGVPVARLIPAGELNLQEMVQAGLIVAPKYSLAKMLRVVPEGKPTTTLSDVLGGMRDSERS